MSSKRGPVPVCFGCEYRHVGCHSDCEIYLDAKKAYEKKKTSIRTIKKENYMVRNSQNNRRNEKARERYARKYGV